MKAGSVMEKRTCTIHIENSGLTLQAKGGDTLMTVLSRDGIHLRSDCGGKGTCGKCRVQVCSGGADFQKTVASCQNAERRSRRACQTVVGGEMTLRIPGESIMSAEVVEKPPLDLGPLVHLSPGSAANPALKVAVDVGTSTVAVYLYDPQRNVVLGSAVFGNPQVLYGRDVMSRISAVIQAPESLAQMRTLIVAAVGRTIDRLVANHGLKADCIDAVEVVGNPTMIHLFWGENPEAIGTHPFMPVSTQGREASGKEAGLFSCSRAMVASMPVISGFLGADIVAAALACDLDHAAAATMLIDVGTNGEILLKTATGLLGASCATGPALEGAAISHGIHATSGAIESVAIGVDGGLELGVIQRQPTAPRKILGICGSGVLSAVAAFRKKGIIAASGGFIAACGHPNLRSDADGGQFFVLAGGDRTESGLPVSIHQTDIRAVQMAKSALITGIRLLCREAGIAAPRHLFLAGAFGNFLNPADAMAIGLLPPLEQNAYQFIGNAAGCGAALLLKSPKNRQYAEKMVQTCHAVDLACHPEFQDLFLKNLSLSTVDAADDSRLESDRYRYSQPPRGRPQTALITNKGGTK